MSTDSLKAGPELDAAVAKACGLHGGPKSSADDTFVRDMPLHCEPWSPSTDERHAFEAAGKVGLFDKREGWCLPDLCKMVDQWTVSRYASDDGVWEPLGTGATPAEAISRAIIALAEPR